MRVMKHKDVKDKNIIQINLDKISKKYDALSKSN